MRLRSFSGTEAWMSRRIRASRQVYAGCASSSPSSSRPIATRDCPLAQVLRPLRSWLAIQSVRLTDGSFLPDLVFEPAVDLLAEDLVVEDLLADDLAAEDFAPGGSAASRASRSARSRSVLARMAAASASYSAIAALPSAARCAFLSSALAGSFLD